MTLPTLALLLVSCADPASDVKPVAAPPKAAPADKIKAENPSPLRLEREVREAGIAGGLAGLVPATFPATTGAGKDGVAIRTGVVLAYTVLAGPSVPKPVFLERLRSIRAGMNDLGTGQGLMATVDQFITAVENDTASRDDFMKELDDVASHAMPEAGWGERDATGPLVQAGAWLAGSNLVARAIVASNNAEAAKLLKRPGVGEYFLDYVKKDGAAKAGGLTPALTECLDKLIVIGNKPAPTVEDAKAVVEATDGLLSLL